MTTQTQPLKPSFPVPVDMPVEFAFEIDGVNNWQFVDPMNTPNQRAIGAITAYEELRMRTTYEHLEKENEFMLERFKLLKTALDGNKGKISLSQAFEQISKMEEVVRFRMERMSMQVPLMEDHIYKLASVVFFTEEENPYKYDMEYNKKKIEKWKKAGTSYDFFLRQPLRRLMPFLEGVQEISPTSFQEASRVAARIVELQLTALGGTKYS